MVAIPIAESLIYLGEATLVATGSVAATQAVKNNQDGIKTLVSNAKNKLVLDFSLTAAAVYSLTHNNSSTQSATAPVTATTSTASSTSTSTAPNGKKPKWYNKLMPIINALVSLGFDKDEIMDAFDKGDYPRLFAHIATDVTVGGLIPCLADKVFSNLVVNLVSCVISDLAAEEFLGYIDSILKYRDNDKIKVEADNERDKQTLLNRYDFDEDTINKCIQDGYNPTDILNSVNSGLSISILQEGWANGKTTKEIIQELKNKFDKTTSIEVDNNKKSLVLVA